MLNRAVILAGGQATRLGPLAADVPKPMLEVAGRPFVDHLIWNVRRHGISDVTFAVGRHADQLVEHIGDGSAFGIHASFAVEEEPLGTGGALALATEGTGEWGVLVLNGDTLFDLNYLDLGLMLRESLASDDDPVTGGADVAIALRAVEDVSRFGAVSLDSGRITAFDEKGRTGPGLVNGGVYVLRGRTARELRSDGAWSLEHGLLAPLVEQGRAIGRAYPGAFVDIGIPEALEEARASIAAWRHKPAVFLDRDGVINEDRGHVHSVKEFAWMPGAVEGVKAANDAGHLAIVVTNQAGIGRGLYDEATFEAFTTFIEEALRASGAHLDATYFCPHHPEAAEPPYLVACECRKPEPGMLLEAARDWDVDMADSVMVGDSDKDMEAARAAGIRGVRYEGGDLGELVRSIVGRA